MIKCDLVRRSVLGLHTAHLKCKTCYLTFRKALHMTKQTGIIRLKVEGRVRRSDHRIITKVTKGKEDCGR